MTKRPDRAIFLASILFLLSGATGLAYEVIWFKRFTHVWGGSSLALTVVVASFLGGLGLGAWLIGRWADRQMRPLRWYGWCEIGIAGLALLVPLEIAGLYHVAGWLYPLLSDVPLALALVRAVLTFLVIGPTCFLMGGSLPLLVKQFTRDFGSGVTPWLYAVNTMGAAIGCFATGFLLLPSFGLTATNLIAVCVNLALGSAAVLASRALAPLPIARIASQAAAEVPAGGEGGDRKAMVLLACAGATGFAALSIQLVWTRQLALALGGTTYAFTAVLLIVLVGIAAGSLLFRFVLQPARNQIRVLAGTLLVLVAGASLGKSLVPQVSAVVALLHDVRGDQLWNASVCLFAAACVQLVPAVAMGVLFPWFVHHARFTFAKVGTGVGRVYAWNTIGTILGSFAATFLLMPAVGISASLGIGLLIYLATWLALCPVDTPRRRIEAGAVAALLVVLAAPIWKPQDPRVTATGIYMYGYTPPDEQVERFRVLHYADGVSCSVLVRELKSSGFRSLSVNGKVDASDGGDDMPMQLGLAYLPAFLRPDAEQVLVIGYGSGCTPGASLLFPRHEVTCCEIEPSIFEASPFFSHVNHTAHESPRLKMVFNDGRNHLQGSEQVYDVILSEPSNPWLAGVCNLFTREFYRETKERLSPGGILAQWIQTYSMEREDYAAVARTVMTEFSNCALIRISKGDTILIAADEPILPDDEQIGRSQEIVDSVPAIGGDLKKYFGTTDVRSLLLGSLLLDAEGVKRYVAAFGDGEIISDSNLRLEYTTPLALFRKSSTAGEITEAILAQVAPDWIDRLVARWKCDARQLESLEGLERLASRHGVDALVEQIANSALAMEPHDPHFLASRAIVKGAATGSAELHESLPHIIDKSPIDGSRVGVTLCTARRHDNAVYVFQELTARYPDSATTWANLSVNLRAQGHDAKATQALDRAFELDPFNDFVLQLRREHGLALPSGRR